MGWSVELETSSAKAKEDLAGVALEEPSRKGEREQLDAARAAALGLIGTVSSRERVLISLAGHSDPDAEGFDARLVSVSVSRLDPAGAEQRAELEAQAAELREREAEEEAARQAQLEEARARLEEPAEEPEA